MRSVKYLVGSSALFLMPFAFASAQLATVGAGDGGRFQYLLKNILDFSDNVLIPFILGIGFLVFVWGMFKYFIVGGANDEAKEQGKSLMVYAVLAFVLIIVFWGIINLLATSTGLEGKDEGIGGLVPSAPLDIK